ncbi:MAG: hypothetical protein Q4E06_00395 [Lautropia sp.]|nr:hypothetical protein [Lautropia sp.]
MNRVAKRATLAIVTAVGLGASLSASAVEYPVTFGEPIVLSQQGQRLKVLLPFQSAPNDRATAAAFLVEEADVPATHKAPVARDFTVMRPDSSPYVIFHSKQDVHAPSIVLTVSVAGDENSPYQMRLNIPGAGSSGTTMLAGADTLRGARLASPGQNSFRRIRPPQARTDLPPK